MLLTDLPFELIEAILIYCDPVDVAHTAQTCSPIRNIVYFMEDSMLWRELYLMQPFDDPREAMSHDGRPKPSPIAWKEDVQSIIRARTVLTADDGLSLIRPGELSNILRTLLTLVCYVRPLKSTDDVSDVSPNLAWVVAVLQRGFLDQLEAKGGWNFEERQLIARLHTYYGITRGDISQAARIASRGYVYDMANYRPESHYGPLLIDGTVNWEHIQAIHHVVSMHVVDFQEGAQFEYAIFPMSMPYSQIVLPTEPDEAEVNDWAGVVGHWTVSFCFCDHRDLMLYNENTADKSLFEEDDFREVFRSLRVKFTIRKLEANPDQPDRPIIHFFGEMNDLSTSTMIGTVRMTNDNQVQWRFVSGEQGNAIWSSEGIQIGGLGSSFGVLGSWTTVFHDDDDPVGSYFAASSFVGDIDQDMKAHFGFERRQFRQIPRPRIEAHVEQ